MKKIFATALAIFLGVSAALLFRDYYQEQRAAAALQELTPWMRKESTQAIARSDARRRERDQAARTARAESALGKDLARRCDEFTAARRANGGTFAAEQQVIACRNYSRYVQTGKQPTSR